MDQITSQKARKRANRDLQFVEQQITDLRHEREQKLAGYQIAEELLTRRVDEIRAAMNEYDTKNAQTNGGQPSLREVEAVREIGGRP